MNKKLPSVFVNMQDKPINNNQKLFYSKMSDRTVKKETLTFEEKMKIKKRINDLFNSPRFVYKLPVSLNTTNGNIDTIIVAKKGDNLVTLDNKLIDINSIISIEEK